MFAEYQIQSEHPSRSVYHQTQTVRCFILLFCSHAREVIFMHKDAINDEDK